MVRFGMFIERDSDTNCNNEPVTKILMNGDTKPLLWDPPFNVVLPAVETVHGEEDGECNAACSHEAAPCPLPTAPQVPSPLPPHPPSPLAPPALAPPPIPLALAYTPIAQSPCPPALVP
nr:vegetative cell wall protein gp1-like [Penaeus vannamei]